MQADLESDSKELKLIYDANDLCGVVCKPKVVIEWISYASE